jgi:O-antigen/teichoic acid export membrane protein
MAIAPTSILASWLGMLGYQAAGFVLSIGTIGVAAVAVPPAAWGEYGMLLSIVQFGYAIGLSWLSQCVLRIGRQEFAESGHISVTLSTCVALAVACFAGVAVLVWLVAPLASGLVRLQAGSLLLVVVALAAFAMFEMTSYAAQATGRFDGYKSGQLVYRAGPLAMVALIWFGVAAEPVYLLGGAAAGWLVAAITTRRATRESRIAVASVTQASVRRIVRYGRLLPIASAASMVFVWMDVWFLGAMFGSDAAGTYWLAFNVLMIGGAILMPLSAAIAPRMIDLRLADDRSAIELRRRIIIGLGLAGAIVVVAGSGPLGMVAGWVLPERYSGAGPLVVLLAASLPAQLMASVASPLVLAYEGNVARVAAVHVANATLKALANLALIPAMGMSGAALATGLVMWFWAVAMVAFIPAQSLAADRICPKGAVSSIEVSRAMTGAILVAAAALAAGLAITRLSVPSGSILGAVAAAVLWVVVRSAGLLAPLGELEALLSGLPPRWRSMATRALRIFSGPARVGS